MTALPPPTGHPIAADTPALPSPRPRRADLLVASGVLSIVSASVLGGLGGLFLVWVAILSAGGAGACVTPTPWAPTWGTALLLHLALFAAVFVSGVGSLQCRAWGRTITLVAQTLVVGALALSMLAHAVGRLGDAARDGRLRPGCLRRSGTPTSSDAR